MNYDGHGSNMCDNMCEKILSTKTMCDFCMENKDFHRILKKADTDHFSANIENFIDVEYINGILRGDNDSLDAGIDFKDILKQFVEEEVYAKYDEISLVKDSKIFFKKGESDVLLKRPKGKKDGKFVEEFKQNEEACTQLSFWIMLYFPAIIGNVKSKIKAEKNEGKISEKKKELYEIRNKVYKCVEALGVTENNDVKEIISVVAYIYNATLTPPELKGETTQKFVGLFTKKTLRHRNKEEKYEVKDVYANYIKAGYNIVIVDTVEDEHAFSKIEEAAKSVSADANIYEWNIVQGIVKTEEKNEINHLSMGIKADLKKFLMGIFDSCLKGEKNTCKVYAIRATDDFMNDSETCGIIKALAERLSNEKRNSFLFFICRNPYVNPMIEKMVHVDNSIGYPDEDEIKNLLNELINSSSDKQQNSQSNESEDELISKCKGLTRTEIKRVVKLLVAEGASSADNESRSSDIQNRILNEKKQIIKKTGLVELVDTDNSLEVGGLTALMDWLNVKAKIIKNPSQASANNVDLPRGVLLIGMPGCGKSLSAKKAASLFNVPLLKIEMGSLMNKYQGESEHNFRDALRLAEAISPCVLWIDELEKAFNNTEGQNQSESSGRILGYLLNWMQERKSMTFVMATANEVKRLPSELLRKGRFDEVFFVDLPKVKERVEILTLHIHKKGFSFVPEEIEKLAKGMDNYSGAEIEYVVRDVAEKRFLDVLDGGAGMITKDMFKSAIENTTPLYESMKDVLEDMREYCKKKKFRNAASNSS